MLVPLHLKHKSPPGASVCQPVIHSLLEWVGVERRRRKRENVRRCTESVRAWVGRVAERAKQTPGMSSVGVRMGGTRGVNPKWQSGSLRVGVAGEHIHVCVCISCMMV